jgi:hypothetical protein
MVLCTSKSGGEGCPHNLTLFCVSKDDQILLVPPNSYYHYSGDKAEQCDDLFAYENCNPRETPCLTSTEVALAVLRLEEGEGGGGRRTVECRLRAELLVLFLYSIIRLVLPGWAT